MAQDHLVEQGRTKAAAARLSVISNCILTGGKIAVGVAIGSIAVIAEGLHSGVDLVAAVMALWSVRKASEPADGSHPFGHGKFESLSAVVEGALILAAAAGIIWAAISRLIGAVHEVTTPLAGAVVMAISAAVNVAVSTMLFRVAHETESPALEADAWHLRTDVYTSIGVLVGMAGIYITRVAGLPGGHVIDPIAAIIVGLAIGHAAWDITWRGLQQLTDRMLPPTEYRLIEALLSEHYPQFVDYHRLRSRRAGSERHIDLHLVVPPDTHIADAHDLCDHLEEDIRRALPNVQVLIHVEPAGHEE
ncbi:MAG: cation transporter [Armatimonadota bacterium]|nr:MAG: cation transporter [Armatimonadota bacterium]